MRTDRTRRGSDPSGLLIAALILPVAIGDLITWAYFGIGCGVAGNSPQVWIDFCASPYGLLPIIGALLAVALTTFAKILRRPEWLWLGAGIGALTALTLWILWGDPAGNLPRDPDRVSHPRSPLALAEHAEQDVSAADVVVLEDLGPLLRENDDLPGAFGSG